MIAHRLGIGLLLGAGVIVALWAGALVMLPDAPGGTHRATRATAPPAAGIVARLRRTFGGPSNTGLTLLVPVAGVERGAIRDSWGDPRDNGLRAHHGTDIMAPGGTPVSAAAPGTVEKMWTSVAGGTTLYVRSPSRTWVYYYAHLAGYAPGLHERQAVRAGDLLGFVGDTGNAGAGNFHLHFGLTRTTPEQHWYQGQDIDPYPYLAGTPLAP